MKDPSPDSFPTALAAAQHYLDWYGWPQVVVRTADRVVIALKPKVHFEILCTDGICVPVEGLFHDTLGKVLAREYKNAQDVVEEIKRQKIAEGIS